MPFYRRSGKSTSLLTRSQAKQDPPKRSPCNAEHSRNLAFPIQAEKITKSTVSEISGANMNTCGIGSQQESIEANKCGIGSQSNSDITKYGLFHQNIKKIPNEPLRLAVDICNHRGPAQPGASMRSECSEEWLQSGRGPTFRH